MSNALYENWKGALLIGQPNTLLLAGTVRVVLVTSAYVFNQSHQFLSDVPAAARVATSGPLTGGSVNISTIGAYDTDDPVLPAVTGAAVAAIILYIDAGTDAASRLVFFEDSVAGIPFTPTGASVTLTVSANGWFVL